MMMHICTPSPTLPRKRERERFALFLHLSRVRRVGALIEHDKAKAMTAALEIGFDRRTP